MDELIIVSPEFSSCDKNIWGGLGVFTSSILKEFADLKKYNIKLLTLGFNQEPENEKYDGLEIIRILKIDVERKGFWINHRKSHILKKFSYRVFLYLQKNRGGLKGENRICIFNDYMCFYHLKQIKKLEYRNIIIFHLIPSESILVQEGLVEHIVRFLVPVLKWKNKLKLPVPLPFNLFTEFSGANYSEKIIVPSKGMKDHLLNYHSISGDKVKVVPWGIGSSWFEHPQAAVIDKIKHAYGIKKDDIVLLFMGRLAIQKGLEYAFDALEILEKRSPALSDRIKFFICGGGSERYNESYVSKIQDKSRRLRKIKVYFPGFVSGEERVAFFDVADILLLPSLFEPFGLVLLEAMARKTAIIASDTNGARDLLKPGFGKIVDFSDYKKRSEGLADTVEKVILNNLPVMKEQAREESYNYSWKRTTLEIDKVINGR